MLTDQVHRVIFSLVSSVTLDYKPHDAANGYSKTNNDVRDWYIKPYQ